MPKLLMVTTIPETICAFLLPYATYFREQGWQVDGMAQGISQFPTCVDTFHQIWNVEWSRNPLDPQNFRLALPQIQRAITQEQYDLVHVHTPVAAFLTRWALRDHRRRSPLQVIYTAHGFHFYAGGSPLKNLIFWTMEKWAGAWTDYLVVINREDEAAAQTARLVPPDRIRYMPGIGLDLGFYCQNRISSDAIESVRAEMGLLDTTPLFLAIAELTPRKRPTDILQAFAQLAHPTAHLAFAGGGPLLDRLQQMARELEVGDRVHFLGFRSDIPELIRASIATVLVSRQEGLPRSVMESLALEVPVIGSRIRGTSDLLAEDCGRLVEVGNIAEISQAMGWMLDHPEAAQSMGHKGRHAMNQYDLQKTLALHRALYKTALEGSP